MEKQNFFKTICAMIVVILAGMNFVACNDSNTDEDLFGTSEVKKNYSETSTLTPDDYNHQAILDITANDGENTLQREIVAKIQASLDWNEKEVENNAKTYEAAEISDADKSSGSAVYNFTLKCSDSQIFSGRLTSDIKDAFGHEFSIKLKNVTVKDWDVKETATKSDIEAARQNVPTVLDFEVEAVGTQTSRTAHVLYNMNYQTWQRKSDITVDRRELEFVDRDITKFGNIINDSVTVKVATYWSDGSKTVSDPFTVTANPVFNAVNLDDMYVNAFGYQLAKVLGKNNQSEAHNFTKGNFKVYFMPILYTASHTNGYASDNITTVYELNVPKIVFEYEDLKYTFDYIIPSVDERGDDQLAATTPKAGYDAAVFRNTINVTYGNAETGIAEKILEERANLYMQQKTLKNIKWSDASKVVNDNDIVWTVYGTPVYSDNTEGTKTKYTTSRPRTLVNNGAWSMFGDNTSETTTNVIMTLTKTEDDTQNFAGGKWVSKKETRDFVNKVTIDGKEQTNSWTATDYNSMVLYVGDFSYDFGTDTPSAKTSDDKLTLQNTTATQESWYYSDKLTYTWCENSKESFAAGTVVKNVQKTLVRKYFANDKITVNASNIFASVDLIKEWSDNTTETIHRDITVDRNFKLKSYWETTEKSSKANTANPVITLLNTQDKTSGDWSFKLETREFVCGITCDASSQEDVWEAVDANHFSVTIEGETFTFNTLEASASKNDKVEKTNETDAQTEYTHSNVLSYLYGGNSKTSTATGKIFVVKSEDHHNGFFDKSYGNLKNIHKLACKSKDNKSYGVGYSLEFEKGSLPAFITKDGIITFGTFEKGSTVYEGACYNSNGKLVNCNGEDASKMMKWTRGSESVNLLTYTDATKMGFNWGTNSVETSHFPGSITKKTGYSIVSFTGVKDANGRTSWDTSF